MKNKITILVLFVVGALAFGMVMSKPVASDHHDKTVWTATEKYKIINLLERIEENTRE